MRKPSVACALLAALVAKHGWGSPIEREHLLRVAAIKGEEYPEARETFAELRSERYVTNRGKRGIELDSSKFGQLADVLYHECEWEAFEVRSRLKHYERWNDHEWA